MTPEQLAVMEQVLADLNKHYPYEDESGIIKLSLGRFMNARENLRTVIEQAKRQQALDKMAENERELGIQMQPEPVDFFDWYDNAIWGNEDFKTGCQRAWNAALEYAAPAAPVQEPNEADELLRYLGLDPQTYRTDGGAINRMKVKAALLHPDEYPRMDSMEAMVNRFLSWPVPASVYPDGTPGQPGRTGTNLLTADEARQMLEHVLAAAPVQEKKCNPHPDAPHGFLRNASHTEGRYVCECEYWNPPAQPAPAQEPVANDWSVFNTGAEVWSGLSMEDAVAELTPERLERGWSAVCVINKDNPPLYTTPPAAQRQWAGLTEQEKHDLLPTVQLKDENPKSQVWLTRKDAFTYASAIEAKLREKNGGAS